MITGLDPNHSIQMLPYLRAILRSSWSGLVFSAEKEKMFPKIGIGFGPFGYCFPFFASPSVLTGVRKLKATATKKLSEDMTSAMFDS